MVALAREGGICGLLRCPVAPKERNKQKVFVVIDVGHFLFGRERLREWKVGLRLEFGVL